MLRTIMIGDYISVQGVLVERHADGRMTVRVGSRLFTGVPVPSTVAA